MKCARACRFRVRCTPAATSTTDDSRTPTAQTRPARAPCQFRRRCRDRRRRLRRACARAGEFRKRRRKVAGACVREPAVALNRVRRALSRRRDGAAAGGTTCAATGQIADASYRHAGERFAMTKPTQALIWMAGFLAAVGLLAGLLATRLLQNFQANPFFNARHSRWSWRSVCWSTCARCCCSRAKWNGSRPSSAPILRAHCRQPKLLAPMARMFGGRERAKFSLSAAVAALDPRQRLSASGGIARSVALSGRPGDLSRPARHVLGPAGDDPLGRRHHRLARRRQRSGCYIQPAQGTI